MLGEGLILTFRNQNFEFLNVFENRFENFETFLKHLGNLQPSYRINVAFQFPKIVILMFDVFKVSQTAIRNYGTGNASKCKYLLCTNYQGRIFVLIYDPCTSINFT